MDQHAVVFNLNPYTDIEPTHEPESCKCVWLAVIEQAFVDARCTSRKRHELSNKKQALDWLTGGTKGFDDVCFKAGLDPDKVREQALRAFL
jgi:hypothetical protein